MASMSMFPTSNSAPSHANVSLDLSKKGAPQFLSQVINSYLARGINIFKIRIPETNARAFPNVCTPIAGIIDYYKAEYGCTFVFSRRLDNKAYCAHIGLLQPYTQPNHSDRLHFLDKIWRFDNETHYDIVSGIVDSIRGAEPMSKSLLNCLELCLNEVTDNALNHSQREAYHQEAHGYVMAQVHHKQHRIAISVYDTGRGILASLKEGGLAPANAHDAISMALKRGVTDGRGAGKGLWMLNEIVRLNSGSFDIVSSGARYSLRHNEKATDPAIVNSDVRAIHDGTTLVDFQLNTDRETNIEVAIPGYDFTDLWTESHEDPSNPNGLRLNVKCESPGLGTRLDARKFANVVYNAASSSGGKIVLNFNGIGIVSLSFADELISQLFKMFGFTMLLNRIEFDGLEPACRKVLDEAAQSRFEGAF